MTSGQRLQRSPEGGSACQNHHNGQNVFLVSSENLWWIHIRTIGELFTHQGADQSGPHQLAWSGSGLPLARPG